MANESPYPGWTQHPDELMDLMKLVVKLAEKAQHNFTELDKAATRCEQKIKAIEERLKEADEGRRAALERILLAEQRIARLEDRMAGGDR